MIFGIVGKAFSGKDTFGKMLAEELNLLIEAQRKRGAQITFDRSKLNENNFSKRSKSNNGPSNIFSGEISVEQAA